MRAMKHPVVPALICLLLSFVLWGCSSDSYNPASDTSSAATLSYVQLPTSADEIESERQQAVAAWDEAIARILAEDNPTFDNTVHALNDAIYTLNKTANHFYDALNLSPLEEVRTAAGDAYLSTMSISRQVYLNTQLYQSLEQLAQSGLSLNSTDQALVDKLIEKFEQNGSGLDEADKAQFHTINDEISALEEEFQGNVTNAQNKLVFSAEQLAGLPDSSLALFERSAEGGYVLDARLYNQYTAIQTYAEDEDTRRQAYVAYNSVAKEDNPAILERLVQLRAQKAALMGYDSYADLQLAPRMAGTATTAMDFLERFHSGTENKLASEIALMLDLKRTHTGDATAQFKVWDYMFYKNLYAKEFVQLDHNSMQKYFSLPLCLQGMFDTFSDVFEIDIQPCQAEDLVLWDSDVQCYEIRDANSGNPLGLFYLDPYPREGKYTWFASSFSYAGNSYRDGTRELPSGILIGNWDKPTGDSPSLLTFDQLITLFHEFGHILNLILMDTTYATLHDNSYDFVEVPSQMLELWCYDQRVLERFAVNYQDDKDVLPVDYVDKIKAQDSAFSVLSIAPTLARGMADLTLHTQYGPEAAVDVDAVYKEVYGNYCVALPEESSPISRFTHLVSGYDAGYYSYLWSLAIVHDLKTRFDQTTDGLLDSETGAALKKDIYQPGFTRDETASVHAFLGRDWSVDAYLKYLAP